MQHLTEETSQTNLKWEQNNLIIKMLSVSEFYVHEKSNKELQTSGIHTHSKKREEIPKS